MNQILISEKIYVTPELKKKKNFFKFEFFLSVFFVCVLFSFYIYAEYDRNKSEEAGKMMLSSVEAAYKNAEKTVLTEEEDKVWTFVLNQTEDTSNQNNIYERELTISDDRQAIHQEVYTDSEGEPYTIIATISIPEIDVEYAVLSRTSDELLKISPTKIGNGPNPNGKGNFCIIGHNYRNSKFFSKVPTLELGDSIYLTDNYGDTMEYILYDKYEVVPTDVSCLNPETDGTREVTLITCTYDGSHRVIAKFREK